MIALLWAKVWKWVCALGALLTAVAGIYFAGRAKGKAAEQGKTRDAQEAATAAQATVHAHEVRNEVENETAKLPDAPAQSVASADPATAAGRLRDDGWTRD